MFKIVNTNNTLTIEDGNKKYGPYTNYRDMEQDIFENSLDIMYEPKDLVFDISNEDGVNVIYLDSKASPGHDNLGSHNVSGLPYGLTVEDVECCWTIHKKLTKNQIIKDMVLLGFTREKFLE